MRVLIWLNGGGVFGGHEVQLSRLMPALLELGVEVEFTDEPPEGFGSFDLVHGLGLSPSQVRACRRAGLPVVLSTVYWDASYRHALFTFRERPQLQRRMRLGLSLAVAGLRLRYLDKLRALAAPLDDLMLSYESADLLLPNAYGEEAAFRADLGVTTPSIFVPNGADPEVFSPAEDKTNRRGVVAAGRFEPHKNQLGLIEALKGLDVPLTVVGPVHPHHAEYGVACERAAGPNVTVITRRVPIAELVSLYQSCQVHVLASWFETTGLVSLEAALCGAKVVSTERGHAREYLEGDASYCDPARPPTIRRAVVEALAAPENSRLRNRILERFTWRQAAEATLRGYRTVLASRSAT